MAHKTPGSICYAAIYYQNVKQLESQVDAKNVNDFQQSHARMLEEVLRGLKVNIKKIPEEPIKYVVEGYPYHYVYICAKSQRSRSKRYLYGCVAKRTYRMRICKNFLEDLHDGHLKLMAKYRYPDRLKKQHRFEVLTELKRIMEVHNDPLNDQYIRGFHLLSKNKEAVRVNIEKATERGRGMDILIENVEHIAENAVDLKAKAEEVVYGTAYAKCVIIMLMIFCVVFMLGVCAAILGVKYGLIPAMNSKGDSGEKKKTQ